MGYITPKSQNRRRHKNMQTINCHWENIFKFRFSNSTQYINYSVFLCENILDFVFYNYSILDFFNVKMTTEIKNIFGQENDAVTAQTGRQTVVKLLGILGRFHGCHWLIGTQPSVGDSPLPSLVTTHHCVPMSLHGLL